MVAYLKKPEGSEGFHQIVDFLNASHIRYALTENPTIYVSLIKQFCQTAIAKTLDNGEIELTATIDGKVKTVIEGSVRRHLQLADADGISSLPTTEIFEQLSLMGGKDSNTQVEFPLHTLQCPTTITTHQFYHPLGGQPTGICGSQPRSLLGPFIADENYYKERGYKCGRGIGSGGSPRRQDTILGDRPAQTRFERLSKQSNDPPLSRVESLETGLGAKAQANICVLITSLSRMREKLEKIGRKIAEIDQDPGISLVQHDAEIQGWYEHDMEFDFVFDAAKEVSTAEKDVSTVEQVSTIGATVTTASQKMKNVKKFLRRISVRVMRRYKGKMMLVGMDKLKNHKKAVKNEQARTREPEEYKAEARKAKPQSKSAKVSQRWSTKVNKPHNIPF
ncbi:hypothetical protein Tco_0363866 [Tanacetum coccineum]